jgi:hypothetical protein
MRYLWGLGIGHRYAHADAPRVKAVPTPQTNPPLVHALPLLESPASSSSLNQQAEVPSSDAVPQSPCLEDPNPDLIPVGREHEYVLLDTEREDQNWYSDQEEENVDHRVQEPESEPDD